MPRVSVIAMTLDHERFAARGLETLAAQTYTDLEVIVTDDGSTDGTPAIIDTWLDRLAPSVSLIRHEAPRGICTTLNEALDRATGELVSVVSLDDVWFPDRLSRHVDRFDALDRQTAVVYSDCEVIDGTGRVTSPSYMASYTPFRRSENRPAPSGDVFAEMVGCNFIAAPGVTIRRAAIDAVGGYREDLPFEDWSMWLQLAPNYEFHFDDQIVAQYRIHDGGYWMTLRDDPATRSHLFSCLARTHGLRDDIDRIVVRRLRAMVEEMQFAADPAAAASADLLAQLDGPKVIPIADPADSTIDAVASLVADGYSVVSVEDHVVTVVGEPSGVLYIAPWMTMGGADKATLDWFRYIPSQSFRRYLLTTLASDNVLFGQCDALADEAWCLPEIVDRQAIPQFVIEFIATRRVDVVHIMNSKLGFDLIPAIKLAFPDVSVVVQLHCESSGRTGYPRYVASRYDSLVNAYSVISEDLKASMVDYHVSPSKVNVIYLGVDATDEFNPRNPHGRAPTLDPHGFHVLFPARLTAQKRPELMLEIAAESALRVPGAQFHVVGDGELRPDLERTRDALGLTDVVRFHGASANMWGWYTACDVVLLCSEFEGIPLVLFEAMSMGVPMVAPLVGGTGEVLDGESGITVEAGAKAKQYADAIAELARDPERRNRIGEQSRQRVLERYQLDDMEREHRRLYGRLIAEAAVRR